MALGDAVEELLFLRQVWRFMLPEIGMPCFPLFVEDNQGAVLHAQNPVTNSNSKHIHVRCHFFQAFIHQEDITVTRVPSECQEADIHSY